MNAQVENLSMDIGVKVMPPAKLATLAKISSRNRHPEMRGEIKLSARMLVNFIRHELTSYDRKMDATRDRRGGFGERDVLRQAILLAIAKRYHQFPDIVSEAKRQLQEKQVPNRALPTVNKVRNRALPTVNKDWNVPTFKGRRILQQIGSMQ
jgi:hypothetical protein